jgi:hypothetical protein
MRNAYPISVRRIPLLALCLAAWLVPAHAAILEHLSLDDLTLKSSAIVRAKVIGSYADFRGSMIYTHWKVQVEQRLKGTNRSTIEVLIPGGSARGFHQDVSGAPKLLIGKEYLLFLWTSRRGSTYITGLSQGLFELRKNAGGEWMVSRASSGEPVIDRATWAPVADENVQMPYAEMTSRISATLKQGGSH